MALYLYDDPRATTFEPFALTRPVSELCAGAIVTRRRWATVAGEPVTGTIVPEHLQDFSEFDAPPAVTRILPARARIANSRCIPLLTAGPPEDVWTCQGRVAAVRLGRSLDPSSLAKDGARLETLVPTEARSAEIPGRWVDDVWDYVRDLPAQLSDDIPRLATGLSLDGGVAAHATCLGQHPLFVERGAIIEPHTVFDLHNGPVLVRSRATVHAFTRVVGPCFIGEATSVTADRIAASSVGEHCKVHGEFSVSIVLGYSNKSHDGFIGHSYLGRWVNVGAGTITSNLKNTYGRVQLWTPGGVRDTGLTFLGAFLGDYVRTGIGVRLTTGSVLGAGANFFGVAAPKIIPPFAWGEHSPFATFALPKLLEVAERQMARRQVSLTDSAKRALAAAHLRALALKGVWSEAEGAQERGR
jgi:UDP-N-acetylglucosamine diphosphorylase / glucose-1-phosphate thymidylyltransferase / UDP-N-acetylgalactosamine diphosphorylase / glucosamine-1-phosphate N-acetyltransferase / galactosamine-1-phosphate N-acetyltransferase